LGNWKNGFPFSNRGEMDRKVWNWIMTNVMHKF
jgi:hypothetical protein